MRNILATCLPILLLACSACSKTSAASEDNKNPKVVVQTNKGPITIQLYEDKAPASVKNFLEYVDAGFYEGTIFHRVIPDFMIQGGGFTKDLQKKTTRPPVKNEADNQLKNERGTVALARTPDPNSATSQFFINLKDNAFLDHKDKTARGWGYAVFGKVIDGMKVVDSIAGVKRLCPSKPPAPCSEPLPPGMRDVPAEPVVIQKVTRK